MMLKKWSALVALVVALACVMTAGAAEGTRKHTSTSKKTAQKDKAKPESTKTQTKAEAKDADKQAKIPASSDEVERITVEELKAKLAKGEKVFIIDSRSQGSYDGSDSKIKGAVRIPGSEVESRLKDIPRDREIVIYCT